MQLKTPQRKKCDHGKNSCPKCSRLKMVVYLTTGEKEVWYSFIKEEQKKNMEDLGLSMLQRYMRRNGKKHYRKSLFFDNTDPTKEPFAEHEQD